MRPEARARAAGRRLSLALLAELALPLAGCPAEVSLAPDNLQVGIEIRLEEEPTILLESAELAQDSILAASVSPSYTEGCAYSWRLDGAVEAIASGKEIAIDLEGERILPGVHALSVFVASGEGLPLSAQSRFVVAARE